MEKWENLQFYKEPPARRNSSTIQRFCSIDLANLKGFGFKLKQSKTVKTSYRINEEFEQSIQFDNSSRWAKNQQSIFIFVSIKPLYAEKEQPYRIFEAYQIDSSFKMFYPLTQEFALLAANIIEKINKYLLPFFDRFASSKDIVIQSKQLIDYKILNSDQMYIGRDLRRLLYDCAFVRRDKTLFYMLNELALQERNKGIEMANKRNESVSMFLNMIEEVNQQRAEFDDDERYSKKIKLLKEKAVQYIDSLNRKKPGRK